MSHLMFNVILFNVCSGCFLFTQCLVMYERIEPIHFSLWVKPLLDATSPQTQNFTLECIRFDDCKWTITGTMYINGQVQDMTNRPSIQLGSHVAHTSKSFFSFSSTLFLLLDHACMVRAPFFPALCHHCPMLSHWGLQLSHCFHSYTTCHSQSRRT